jgi:hypothetical protein
MKHEEKKKILGAIRQVFVDHRHKEVPEVLAELRATIDTFEPPKKERTKRGTRDRQERAGYDRGTT